MNKVSSCMAHTCEGSPTDTHTYTYMHIYKTTTTKTVSVVLLQATKTFSLFFFYSLLDDLLLYSSGKVYIYRKKKNE